MADTEPTVLLCDCAGTMALDADAIARGTGLACSKVHTFLCRDQAAQAAQAMQAGDVIVACAQEAAAFQDLAEDLNVSDRLTCVDIRDRAGWSEDTDTAPKIAALVADARIPVPGARVIDVHSEGICLVLGSSEHALPAAAQLGGALSVTCLIAEPSEILLPAGVDIDVSAGRVVSASGSLGQFAVTVDGYAEWTPAGRGARQFGPAVNGAKSECDVIVDLTGGTPLFPAHHKRDGYFRADPGDPMAVQKVLFDAAQMLGTFEKPLHIRFDASLCAHSRAGQVGCTRCLDLCPTSAIRPDGDHVAIDPNICAGCGACAAACPSGAASADDPAVQHLFNRMRTMASTYRKAGGGTPRLLVHDDHGAEMIRLSARFGRGLPSDVIPMEVTTLSGFGHAEQLAALSVGFGCVDILIGPRTEKDVLETQAGIATAIAGETKKISILEMEDPDALLDTLYGAGRSVSYVEPILPLGGRRDVTRLAASALAGGRAELPIALPEGAPYGAVMVDTSKCTLCLACVSLCPSGALGDNPDRPELNFREEACLQCGICKTVCPETAISLKPQLDLRNTALAPAELHSEEPFPCIECGKPFGVKSTIDKIVSKLEGVHSMFTNSDNARLIQMCDDCRVAVQFKASDNPFQGGERPRVRTTDDYLNNDND